jgi:hypothetical protein
VLISILQANPNPAVVPSFAVDLENRRLNLFFRVAYEIGFFMLVGTLSWQLMSFKHQAMISLHSAMTGLSRGQALEQQNDQSAMWAFSELNDVVYFLVLLYLLRPVCVNLVGSLFKHREPSEAA